jgi:ubiquinone/menaquinone biosynthesis methyltransferase
VSRRFTLRIGDHLQTPEKKKFFNEEVFSEIAPRYDFVTRALSFWHDAAWKRHLVAALPANESPLCIDLACGTGDITFLLARRYPQGTVVGVDITEPMLDLARSRNDSPCTSFLNQDMSHLDSRDASVDIVTGGYALRNAPDLSQTVREIARVLKPGGIAAFLDFSKPADAFSQRLEYWILKLWTGFWGILLHRNHEVYSYIAESLRAYPDRVRLRAVFQANGFEVMRSKFYFFGITEVLVVRKLM